MLIADSTSPVLQTLTDLRASVGRIISEAKSESELCAAVGEVGCSWLLHSIHYHHLAAITNCSLHPLQALGLEEDEQPPQYWVDAWRKQAQGAPSTSTPTPRAAPGSRQMPAWVATPPARCAQCRQICNLPQGPFHQVCTGCFYQSYCSRACQELHWEAGHKDRCALLRARTAAAAAAAKAAGDVYK